MLEETHKRIAEKIAQELKIEDRNKQLLVEGSVAPDLFGDFPHHKGKELKIYGHIFDAVYSYQEDDDECYYDLGKALHYIQDGWTARPGTPQGHTRWEQQINDFKILDNIALEDHIKKAAFPTKAIEAYVGLLKKVVRGIDGVIPKEYESVPFIRSIFSERLAKLTYYALRIHPVLDSDGRPYSTPLLDLNFAYRTCLEVTRCVLSPDADWEKSMVRRGAKPAHEKIFSVKRFRILPAAVGLLWLFLGLGVFVKNLAKYLKWNYIAAWMVLFGIPCAILFKLSFHRIETVEKTSMEEASRPTAITKEETEDEAASIYREAFPELKEEVELRETQEIDMDFEDEEEEYPENEEPYASANLASCRHENVRQIPIFNVGGEPRRVITKCLDCGKVLKTDHISR